MPNKKISDYTPVTSTSSGDLYDLSTAGTTTNSIDFDDLQSSILGYKTYVCQISQSGTSAPSQTVIFNTTGLTPSWVRTGAGSYTLDFTGITGTFYSPMTSDWAGNAILINIHGYDGSAALDGGYMYYWDDAAKKLYLYCYDSTGAAAIDIGTLLGASALYLPEIRFYI
jgi:hypothetical protein